MNPNSLNVIRPIPPALDGMRRDIDWIDDQILDLLEQRYAVVKRVAWAKATDSEPALALRPGREAAIVERLGARAIHVPEGDIAQIWRAILSLSAHHQRAYRILVVGPQSARLALLTLAAARYKGVPIEWSEDRQQAVDAARRGERIVLMPADALDEADHDLDLIGQHATGCLDHPWAVELGRLAREERGSAGWSPDSWQGKLHRQLPAYPDQRLARAAERALVASPALVPSREVSDLRGLVADAQQGRRMLLQAGDCAEPMDMSRGNVLAMAALIDKLGTALEQGTGLPAIRVGRLGGQFAKPRSQAAEGAGAERMLAYRGDAVNGRSACPVDRVPDPARQLHARDQAARVRGWLGDSSVHTSHEALLLPYEAALTRTDDGQAWASSAHTLWLGERTRNLAGAHVEYLRGIANPIGIKCGPTLGEGELLDLLDRLDPHRTAGRIMLVARLGAAQVEQRLAPLMTAVRDAGREVLWLCDPLHGNNRSASGTKVRLMTDIIAETQAFARTARRLGVHAGGLHLEVTPRPVLECVDAIEQATADRPFESLCDPRLNAEQAMRVIAAYVGALEEGK